MSEEHNGEVVSSFIEGGYTALCSCGWEGSKQEVDLAAWDEWENHCDVVFMEATTQEPSDA